MNTGYIFVVNDRARAQEITNEIDRNQLYQPEDKDYIFTDIIRTRNWDLGEGRELFLTSLDEETIEGIALVQRRRTVALTTAIIKILYYIKLKPCPFDKILEPIPAKTRYDIVFSNTAFGKKLPEVSWQKVMAVIIEYNQNLKDEISKLIALRDYEVKLGDNPKIQQKIQEADAANLSLRASDFDPIELVERVNITKQDEDAPFLSGLMGIDLLEDTLLHQDSQILPGFNFGKKTMIATAAFEKNNGDKLTISNFNRTSVEKKLGVDLLYYHHKYNAYTLIQYKRLTTNDNKSYFYRPDKNHDAEIQRMRKFRDQVLFSSTRQKGLADYRLNNIPFYFKLCKCTVFDPLSTQMSLGMYIPLDFWEEMLDSPDLKGPRGGQIFTFDNVPRYFSNTEFILLLKNGWVGSKYDVSNTLTQIINNALNNNRSLMFSHYTPYKS